MWAWGVRHRRVYPRFARAEDDGHVRHLGGSSVGIPVACEGTLTIAGPDQDRSGMRTAPRHAPADQKAFLLGLAPVGVAGLRSMSYIWLVRIQGREG